MSADLEPVQDSLSSIRLSKRSFAELMAEGPVDFVEGQALEKNKSALVGVPFLITKVVYRNSDKVRLTSKGKVPAHYVSLEITTADKVTLTDAIKRGRVLDPTAIRADEDLVVNDGSTGICRDITKYLHGKGIIDVGPMTTEEMGGPLGESAFDRFFGTWVKGADVAEDGFDIRLLVPRGLRVSEYQNEYTDEGVTYYFS